MTYKPVYSHDKLRSEALKDPEVRILYEATKLQIEIAMKLKKARKKRKMTQEDVAKLIHTKKPVISRLESDDDVKHFPSVLTLAKYASAVGYTMKVMFKRAPSKTKRRAHVARGK